MTMRGLTVFITDIRQCTSKEAQQRRIDKELGNIRQKFAQPNIGGYQLKKYIWKIIYMMMLGVDIDFGHMEAVSLISSQKYSEKNVGYVACTLMLTEQNDILRLIIQSIKNDLNSKNENFQCLALTCIANVGGEEFAETLVGDVQRLLVSGSSRDIVKKKAALCLLRLFKKYPEVIQNEAWAPRFIDMMESSNLGVVLSVMSLLLGLAAYEPEHYFNAIPRCINWLDKLHNRDVERGYVYYSQGCPFLQVKILRFLQLFPSPDTPTLYARLLGLLAKIIDEGCREPLSAKPNIKSANKSNAIHAILFETINLIMHYNLAGSHDLLAKSITLLGNCISVADTNLRALSLETMSKLSKIPGTIDAIKVHQPVILSLLKDNDVYLKKRALDVLFNMCDKTNSADIVMELLTALADSEYAIREEMVLKIAILAENFTMDDRWYIDVVLKLIQLAGDFVVNDIWYRVIQVVTNNDNLQAYASQAVYDALSKPTSHETLTKLGGYILGEFGHLIEEQVSSKSQFMLLQSKFSSASYEIQALLLSTFMKIWNLYPHLKPVIAKVMQPLRSFIDDELQQRAVEYNEMLEYSNQELMSAVWEMMPAFPERASALLQHLRQSEDNSFVKSKRHGSDSDENENEEGDDDQFAYFSQSDQTESESSSRSPSPQNKVHDLLSMDDFLGDTKSDSNLFPEQASSLVRQILLTSKGVLYECDALQIGAMIHVEGTSHVKMILYFGNKTAMTPLIDVNLHIAVVKGVRVQKKPDQPFCVHPKVQEPLYLLWQVAQPVPAQVSATLALSFNGSPIQVNLILPVAVNLFSSPNPLSGQSFIEAWKQNSNNEHQFILQSYNDEFVPATVMEQIASGLRFHIIQGADPSGRSIVGCANFYHLVANGMTSQVPMLIRVELKNNAMRVTCRSTHQLVTSAIESAFKAVF